MSAMEDREAGDLDKELSLPEMEEFEAKQPENQPPGRRPLGWLPLAASCMCGTVLAATIAGVLINKWPESQQVAIFFLLVLVLAPAISFIWHWFFHLRPDHLARKLQHEETKAVGPGPIHPK